jgi:hypothetical protein
LWNLTQMQKLVEEAFASNGEGSGHFLIRRRASEIRADLGALTVVVDVAIQETPVDEAGQESAYKYSKRAQNR